MLVERLLKANEKVRLFEILNRELSSAQSILGANTGNKKIFLITVLILKVWAYSVYPFRHTGLYLFGIHAWSATGLAESTPGLQDCLLRCNHHLLHLQQQRQILTGLIINKYYTNHIFITRLWYRAEPRKTGYRNKVLVVFSCVSIHGVLADEK